MKTGFVEMVVEGHVVEANVEADRDDNEPHVMVMTVVDGDDNMLTGNRFSAFITSHYEAICREARRLLS